MIDESILIELRLVVGGIPGLLAAKIEHLVSLGVVRVTDERGPWVDLDAHVFMSGDRYHWEGYARAVLDEFAERLIA